MISHLTEGLAFLTGSTYQLFSSVNVERPTAGTRVSPFRNGTIVVGRYRGRRRSGKRGGGFDWRSRQMVGADNLSLTRIPSPAANHEGRDGHDEHDEHDDGFSFSGNLLISS
jgi:hypothetical protein